MTTLDPKTGSLYPWEKHTSLFFLFFFFFLSNNDNNTKHTEKLQANDTHTHPHPLASYLVSVSHGWTQGHCLKPQDTALTQQMKPRRKVTSCPVTALPISCLLLAYHISKEVGYSEAPITQDNFLANQRGRHEIRMDFLLIQFLLAKGGKQQGVCRQLHSLLWSGARLGPERDQSKDAISQEILQPFPRAEETASFK